jgi:hypothetical protein
MIVILTPQFLNSSPLIHVEILFQEAKHPQDAQLGAYNPHTEDAGHSSHASTETGQPQLETYIHLQNREELHAK